jgi:hypothetical protein
VAIISLISGRKAISRASNMKNLKRRRRNENIIRLKKLWRIAGSKWQPSVENMAGSVSNHEKLEEKHNNVAHGSSSAWHHQTAA